MHGIGKLEDRAIPPQETFYSRLKNEDISDDDYARCHAVWRDNRMKTMRDFLMWYNNRDVEPFLEAIDKQFATMRKTSPKYEAKRRVYRLYGTMTTLYTCGR